MSDSGLRHIVLDCVPDGLRREAAEFLADCFSLSPSAAADIAAAAPIAVLSGLSAASAAAVLAEIGSFAPAGVSLRIVEEADDGDASRLQWPQSPRIFGRPLAEFSENREVACPLCGGKIRFLERNEAFGMAAAGESAQLSRAAGGRRKGISSFPERAGPSCGPASFMKPGAFAVVTGRMREPQAINLAAELMGINREEAWSRCQEPCLCVAEDVSLAEARSLKARFAGLGVKVRIAKPS